MQNKHGESTSANLTKGLRTEQASFSKSLLVLGGAVAVFFLIKGLKKLFAPYNPPIIIKSGSFIIGTRRDFGDLEEGDTDPEDDDLIAPSYFRRKRTNIEVRCVRVLRHGEQIRCEKFPPGEPGRCIIKFYFGGCPNPSSLPDVLVKGRFLRVRSKRVLEPVVPGHPRYFFRHTSGGELCAIIFRRVGNGDPTPLGDPIVFPNDNSVHLELDSDLSRCREC